MKKLFALILAAVFVFALSACDNKGENPKEQTNNQTIATQSDVQKENTDLNSSQPTDSKSSQTESDTNLITRDRAIELALNHAGLKKADVRELEAELDRERGGVYWEVDFESGNLEYSYDINAETEEIQKIEKERD